MDRIINWKNGSGMQLENSIAAISSSGILGFGFNNTPIYFPEAGTDFIFSVFASNFGFLGSSLLIIYFSIFNVYLIN
jgi:rod shape determining protein RodA